MVGSIWRTSHRWVQTFLWTSFVLTLTASQSTEEPTNTASLSPARSESPAETGNLTSALLIAASIAPELAAGNFSNPIPLPTDAPQYDDLKLLAAIYPPLPQVNGTPNIEALVDVPAPSESAKTKRQSVTRVMIVGDSMTHCNEGDYTWRYRISQWFQSQNIAVDFVGPYQGTAQPDEPAPPSPPPLYGSTVAQEPLHVSGGYAADFDSSHFAVSGRAAAVVQYVIQEVSSQYPADLMLIMLGFNDLGWFYSDDDGLISNMNSLINNARRSNPNMKFVIGTVPHRTFIGGRQDLVINTDSYNRMLKAEAPGWSTQTSPVVVAPVREEYDCGPQYPTDCPAAYDGLHPNELGEYQIARAYSRALVSALGIGSSPLTVPGSIPARPLPVPSNLQMAPSPLGLTATWDKVYGAYQYDVEYVLNGGAIYNFSPGAVRSNRWDTKWPQDGWIYEIRVRASAGNRKGGWTGWISGTASPKTASGPENVHVSSSGNSLVVTWSPATGAYADSAFLYNIIYWDMDSPCSFLLGAAFQGSSAQINDVTPGHRYLIAIETWNSAGGGFPFVAKNIIVGGGTPGAPQNLQMVTADGAHMYVTWDSVPGAAGYIIWRRSLLEAGSTLARGSPNNGALGCEDVYFQFPGTWNYEYAVSAYNGDNEGNLGTPKDGPNAVAGASIPMCPADATPVCFGGGAAPGTDPIDPSDPVPPGTGGGGNGGTPTPAPDPTCVGASCQTCSGSLCQGCTGSCAGCSGSGCNGCTGKSFCGC
ncbi:carbohydrate esterase family 3 protein [Cadophora sp. DSE1049]|nr:carbohydrate esterase family 3 protein [Cadophora sp. DSE1049]